MLLTIRDVPEELVRRAKIATAKGTGSQAFIAGIELMLEQRDQIADMREEITRLRETIGVYQGVLADAHSAAVQLAEIAGQKDLFQSDNPLRPGYRPRR
ncbi:hypothetical protein D9M68_845290 [compost metagenome]